MSDTDGNIYQDYHTEVYVIDCVERDGFAMFGIRLHRPIFGRDYDLPDDPYTLTRGTTPTVEDAIKLSVSSIREACEYLENVAKQIEEKYDVR